MSTSLDMVHFKGTTQFLSRRRETSSSIVVQVLAGRDALGCLCPVLPTRLGSTVESESRKKTWKTDETKGRKASI